MIVTFLDPGVSLVSSKTDDHWVASCIVDAMERNFSDRSISLQVEMAATKFQQCFPDPEREEVPGNYHSILFLVAAK